MYNVEYSRKLSNGEWFDFDQYKKVEKKRPWTLEHIHAQSSECLDANKRTEWRDWIAYTIAARKSIIYPTPKVPIVQSFIQELEAKKAILDKEFETNVFKVNFEEEIRPLFNKDLDLWSEGKTYTVLHQLSNLALLSGDINSGLGKGSFSAKQQYINKCIADGRFIPICTKRVFLKHYYDEKQHDNNDEADNLLNQQLYTWDDKDRYCYLEDIKKVLSTYFPSDKF